VLFNNIVSYKDKTASPTDESMCKEHWWNDTDREYLILGRKPVPVLLLTPQIPNGLQLELNPGPCSKKMVRGIKRQHQRSIIYFTFTS
jgi:hypothetical protein